MGAHMTRGSRFDSPAGSFPTSTHKNHVKPKDSLMPLSCATLLSVPLLFHPSIRGCHVALDPDGRAATRWAGFCDAITFSRRPVAPCERVRLKIVKNQSCWSGAVRLGFTARNPSLLDPCCLPRYSCPDLVAQSGFWAKPLPEELAEEGSVVTFWVDRKGRVFCRVNDSAVALFFSGVDTGEPLWALIDVYGLTQAVQLLGESPPACAPSGLCFPTDSELATDCPWPHSCQQGALPHLAFTAVCPVPQNCFNSQQAHLLPAHLNSDLQLHTFCGGQMPEWPDSLLFTSRPLRSRETVFLSVAKSGCAHSGMLALWGLTSQDPRSLRPRDLPPCPDTRSESEEFWAVSKVMAPLQSSDILSFVVDRGGRLVMRNNGVRVGGSEVSADASCHLWMFFCLQGSAVQLRILGSAELPGQQDPLALGTTQISSSCSTPSGLHPSSSEPPICTGHTGTVGKYPEGTSESIPVILPKSFLSRPKFLRDECTICCENPVDAVIYTCGHMCLCYTCGLKLKSTSSSCCPICRKIITDVIKTYSST
ncbi:E3 ubiquitin-protein ligase NEURL1-like [Arapaima gigas]